MRLIPVLDIKGGVAVHAVGGDRTHYRPVCSVLHPSADPCALGAALRAQLGCEDLYVADLDAIAGEPPDLPVLDGLASVAPALWIDAGVRDDQDASLFRRWPAARLVLGLESIRGSSQIAGILAELGPDRLVFSLDLRRGRPVVSARAERAWASAADDPVALVDLVCGLGVRSVLILELARVGTSGGLAAWAIRWLETLRPRAKGVAWFVGGGLGDPGEIEQLANAGCDGILIASALHSGRIGAADVARWRPRT
jgi:phosphoribosylformimino-5-aminoimidazole carboxamide ribotide isomerase